MKVIKVLGPGCPKCNDLYLLTDMVTRQMDLDCTIEKITDIQQITSYGVLMTPALVVDEEVKISGKIPTADELKRMLT
jgi:small redox-active disulfide protein 2